MVPSKVLKLGGNSLDSHTELCTVPQPIQNSQAKPNQSGILEVNDAVTDCFLFMR